MKTNVTRATVTNIVFALVCAVVALSQETEFVSIIPAKYKHWVTLVAFGAMWIKSHWNYFVDSQGNTLPLSWVNADSLAKAQISVTDKGFK